MIVVGLIGVVAAIAVPMMGNALGFFRLSGDAHCTANAISLAKMRVLRVRACGCSGFLDELLPSDIFDKTTSTWAIDGGSTNLSQRVRFDSARRRRAANTTLAINRAPLCKSNALVPLDIPNTACIIFNSRGTPIDSSGAPSSLGSIYLTDGTAVYGITLSATGMVRTWRTNPTAIPNWTMQ